MQHPEHPRQHFTFHVEMDNAHAVLPRVLLVFSRRRLRIETMHFSDPLGNTPRAHLELGLSCSERLARDVTAQLERIIEVHQAFAEPVARSPKRAPGTQHDPNTNDETLAAMLA